MHDDEIAVSAETVRALVAAQFPVWAAQAVVRVASSGTVNAIFRVGDHLAARFPLRAADPVALRGDLRDEAAAAAEFAQRAPFPAPVPVAIGEPGFGFPLPWSVQTWVAGPVGTSEGASGSEALACDLADLIVALRATDTRGRSFARRGRGGDLHDHDAWVETCLEASAPVLDVGAYRDLWATLRDLPRTAPDVICHSDLMPANVLVDGGRLVGVLDGGGFGPADPALDVIAGWHLLDGPARSVLRARLGCGDLEWERSRAWAFVQAIGAHWYYRETNPTMFEMADVTLRRVRSDGALG